MENGCNRKISNSRAVFHEELFFIKNLFVSVQGLRFASPDSLADHKRVKQGPHWTSMTHASSSLWQ